MVVFTRGGESGGVGEVEGVGGWGKGEPVSLENRETGAGEGGVVSACLRAARRERASARCVLVAVRSTVRLWRV